MPPRRYSEEERAAFLLELSRSDGSIGELARRKGIPPNTAHGWLRRARKSGGGSGRGAKRRGGVAFAPLVAASELPQHSAAIVVEVGTARVRVGSGCDRALLHMVVEALTGSTT